MQLPTFGYDIKKDGTHTREDSVKEFDESTFAKVEFPELPGVIVGHKVEELPKAPFAERMLPYKVPSPEGETQYHVPSCTMPLGDAGLIVLGLRLRLKSGLRGAEARIERVVGPEAISDLLYATFGDAENVRGRKLTFETPGVRFTLHDVLLGQTGLRVAAGDMCVRADVRLTSFGDPE